MTSSISSFTNNLGPQTTEWAQPASCTTGFAANDHEAWLNQRCTGDAFGPDPDCWPPRTEAAASLSGALSTWGIYSPGTVCPSGKVAACSYDGSQSTGGFQFYFQPGPSQTAIGCCPSSVPTPTQVLPIYSHLHTIVADNELISREWLVRGYFCYGEQKCALSISSSTIVTVHCSDSSDVDLATVKIPYTTSESSSAATITMFSAYAPLLQLMYENSDISATTSTPSTTSPSSGQQTDTSGSEGLSTGESAGIGVGVGLGIILLALAAFWIWRTRRKNARARAADRGLNLAKFHDVKPGGSEVKRPQELEGYNVVPEIDSGVTSQEMDGEEVHGPRPNTARVLHTSPIELA